MAIYWRVFTRYKLIRSNINQLHVRIKQRKIVILQIVLFKIYVYVIHVWRIKFMEAEYWPYAEKLKDIPKMELVSLTFKYINR